MLVALSRCLRNNTARVFSNKKQSLANEVPTHKTRVKRTVTSSDMPRTGYHTQSGSTRCSPSWPVLAELPRAVLVKDCVLEVTTPVFAAKRLLRYRIGLWSTMFAASSSRDAYAWAQNILDMVLPDISHDFSGQPF